MKRILEFISKKPAFWQMYLIIIVTVVIIITSLGFIYHESINKKLTVEYLNNGTNLLLQSRSALNHIINTVYNASAQIHANKNFIYLVRNNEKLDSIERGSIVNVLQQIKNSSEYIESVVLYIRKGNETYCTDYGFSTLGNYPDEEYINKYTNHTGPLFLVNQRDVKKSIIPAYKPPYKVITIVSKVEHSQSNNLLIVNMDVDKLYDSVIDVLEIGDKTEIFVVSDEGELILGNTKSQILNDVLPDQILLDIIHSDSNYNNVVSFNNEKYLANCISLELFNQNMNLVWITHYDVLDSILKPFRRFCILVSVIIILIVLLIEIFVIMNKTKQIDELIYKTFKKKGSYGRNKNIFASLHNYVNSINENNARMKEKLDRVMIVFRENYLRSLLVKSNPDSQEQDDVYKRLEEYDIKFLHNSFYVITVDIINLHEFANKKLNVNIVKYIIEELLYYNLQKSGLSGEKVSINDERVSLIINTPKTNTEGNRPLIHEFVKNVGNDIKKYKDVNAAIGISSEGKSIGELNILYRQSLKAMKYRLLEKQNAIVFYDEIIDRGGMFEQDNVEIEEKLTGYIMTGDEEKANKLINLVFCKLKDDISITEKVFQGNVLHLISILMIISAKIKIDIYNELGEDAGIFDIMGRLKTIKEAEVFFAELVKRLCKKVKEKTDTMEVCYMKKILSYIEDNYSKDISMDTLSDNIGISPSYIQKLFKNNLKTTFVKYLTKKRIEKACEYLEQGMKVKEISRKIGFTNTKYFIQVFKKHMGCTPNEVKRVLNS